MLVKLENDKIRVSVNTFGAELDSIRKQDDDIEYLWQGDPKHWGKKAPVLFPFVGRLKNNQYKYKSKKYEMKQHGFARDNEFLVISTEKSEAVFEFRNNNETKKVYPFDFSFIIKYKLDENKIITQYIIKNTGSGEMWFSIGAHPGFNCPIMQGETRNDYYLEFDKKEVFFRYNTTEGLQNGENELLIKNDSILNLSYDTFIRDAIILKNTHSKEISLKSHNHERYVKVDYKDFEYLGIWSKSETSPFVCIEPWLGIADHINSSGNITEKEGMIKIIPGQQYECSIGISIF